MPAHRQPEQPDALDPFGTAALRAHVLDAWAGSPARLREDANAEEDLALGGYRDRLVVELAQNAADAASRAGVAGRLLLRLDGDLLVVANTGALLDAAGVEALSTLRASAKRDGATVGRFGVGFAAVRAVADEIRLGSATGAVQWSLALTTAAVAAIPALDQTAADRAGSVPVLRLPHPASVAVPDGYDTAVEVLLRDPQAVTRVTAMLVEVGTALLLALPALSEITVDAGTVRTLRITSREDDVVVVTDGPHAARWLVVAREGRLDPALLRDRPTEERVRDHWSVTWALPLDGADAPAAVLHAPTPTDEPLDLPALLIASVPLEPTRRRTTPSALLDAVTAHAGETYAELLVRASELLPVGALLALVPGPAAAGEVDAAIRAAALRTLREAAFLPSIGSEQRLRPRDAVVVEGADDGVLEVVGDVVAGLLAHVAVRRAGVLERLGVRRLRLVDVIDMIADVSRPAAWWRSLYDALGEADRDALGALPVPLVDGRLVRGARGAVLAEGGVSTQALQTLGLRVVDPVAASPLLERLGATRATPRGLLDDEAVRAAVEASHDAPDDEAQRISDAVLALVAAASVQPGEIAWLRSLLLPDSDGELVPAEELMLSDGAFAAVVAPGSLGVVAPELVGRWGRDVLAAAGVLDGLTLLRDEDVLLDGDASDHDLDDEDAWLDDIAEFVGSTGVAPEMLAVRDLDLVRDDAWPSALALLSVPPLRAAVVDSMRVVLARSTGEAPPYTAWWLRQHAQISGVALPELAIGVDSRLDGLYARSAASLDLDDAFAAAVGVRTTLEALLAEPHGAQELLDRLADVRLVVGSDQLAALYVALSSVDPAAVSPPSGIRVSQGATTRVVAAADALVLDAPDLLPLLTSTPLVVVPHTLTERIADVLGLDLASEHLEAEPPVGGVEVPVPDVVRSVLPQSLDTWFEHDELVVDGIALDWRVDSGRVHACTTDGLAAGLAWAGGRWELRWLVAALLAEPERTDELLRQAALDPVRP